MVSPRPGRKPTKHSPHPRRLGLGATVGQLRDRLFSSAEPATGVQPLFEPLLKRPWQLLDKPTRTNPRLIGIQPRHQPVRNLNHRPHFITHKFRVPRLKPSKRTRNTIQLNQHPPATINKQLTHHNRPVAHANRMRIPDPLKHLQHRTLSLSRRQTLPLGLHNIPKQHNIVMVAGIRRHDPGLVPNLKRIHLNRKQVRVMKLRKHMHRPSMPTTPHTVRQRRKPIHRVARLVTLQKRKPPLSNR